MKTCTVSRSFCILVVLFYYSTPQHTPCSPRSRTAVWFFVYSFYLAGLWVNFRTMPILQNARLIFTPRTNSEKKLKNLQRAPVPSFNNQVRGSVGKSGGLAMTVTQLVNLTGARKFDLDRFRLAILSRRLAHFHRIRVTERSWPFQLQGAEIYDQCIGGHVEYCGRVLPAQDRPWVRLRETKISVIKLPIVLHVHESQINVFTSFALDLRLTGTK